MNILFYRYGSICEPDIIAEFQELGNFVSEISTEIIEKNLSGEKRIELVSNSLFSHSYDFVFSINFFPFLSEVCNIFQIRYVCWTVDSPVMELFSNSLSNEWNRIFLFDQAQYRDFSAYNPSHIYHLPLATSPKRWDAVINESSVSDHERFKGDISFVGSLYTEKCPYDRLTNPPAYLSGYLEGLINSQLKIYGYNFLEEVLPDDIIADFKAHLPGFYCPPESARKDDRATMAQLYLDAKISALERTNVMTTVGIHYPLNLYTGSDTTNLPVQNKGLVKSLTEMPLVFHNSKINLNITSKSIREGIPLRVFDVLGCGGFLITNYQTELPDCFSIGDDLDVYTSMDDLLTKIDYYLSHEADRIEIAHNGYEKIRACHNYPERLLDMISLAFSN